VPAPRESPLSQRKPHIKKPPGDLSRRDNVARATRVESVFLNIPYDAGFEDLYLAYIVGLTQLGLRTNAAIAVPNQGRLNTIIRLIEKSDFSIHDLSRIEVSRGVPRFNMPVELGLALYRSHATKGRHRVFIFESRRYRAQRSTSEVNGIDAQIHKGTPKGLMSGLRGQPPTYHGTHAPMSHRPLVPHRFAPC